MEDITTNGVHKQKGLMIDEKILIGVDVGGSLIKIAYVKKCFFSKDEEHFLKELSSLSLSSSKNLSIRCEDFEIMFYIFNRTKKLVDQLVALICKYSHVLFQSSEHKIQVTGACANSLKHELEKKLDKKMYKIESILLEYYASYTGIGILNGFNESTQQEWFTYEKQKFVCQYENYAKANVESMDNSYILIYIGTGTSILHISNNKITYLLHFNISGGTYFGLCKLLCNFQTFDEAIKASELGDNNKIDYTMLDMIGGNIDTLKEITEAMKDSNATECGATDDGPDVNFIINSFGKMTLFNNNNETYTKSDIANAILLMVINSTTLNACHFAKRFNCKQIFYAGSFLLNNSYAKFKIAKLVRYLSNDSIKAVFSDKDAFINALGALYSQHSTTSSIEFESFM